MIPLAEFPPEVLAIIFAGDASFLVINIWKCGSSVLNYKLQRSIESITLKDKRDWTTSRWPKCLTTFRQLKHLSVSKEGWLMPTPMALLHEMLQLPPTIETLEIESIDMLWDVPQFCNESTDTVVPASRVNYATSLLINNHCERVTPFPHLKSVWIRAPQSQHSCSPLLAQLFATATTAKFVSWDGSLNILPPNIERIEGSVIAANDRYTPSSLKYISRLIAYHDNAVALTRKGVKVGALELRHWWGLNSAASYPQDLESLRIGGINTDEFVGQSIEWPTTLPKTLTKLHCAFELSDALVALLPRSITSLGTRIEYLAADLRNGVQMDLPNLKEWRNTADLVDPFILHKLPSSVTTFLSSFRRVEGFVPRLPEYLEEFNFYDWTLPFPACISSLQHLKTFIGAPTRDQLDSLPPTLTNLELTSEWLTDDERSRFAHSFLRFTSLSTLKVKNWSARQFDLIPRTIRVLDIANLQSIDRTEIEQILQFTSLPPLLKSLQFFCSATSVPKPACFLQLPYISIEVNGTDPRLPALEKDVLNSGNARCFPDLRISGLAYPKAFFSGDSIDEAVPEDALKSAIWSHLDNESLMTEIKLRQLAPSHWTMSQMKLASRLDSCMEEPEEDKRLESALSAVEPLSSDSVQSRLVELCTSPHWTARKLGIAICLVDHENYVSAQLFQASRRSIVDQ